jgi:hypothetical protein
MNADTFTIVRMSHLDVIALSTAAVAVSSYPFDKTRDLCFSFYSLLLMHHEHARNTAPGWAVVVHFVLHLSHHKVHP